ncbi:hypothetical protein FDUTEX481_04283 [Tolypothrix sp. PCC 7601]|nr:hypothetical protein FDUTEX481_04283 [Tolypothrix sp. PCC 7601]BAY95243.1 hypothetical protein NIES3275_73000 [Microchaete diplosiphon NIES-3275]
MKFTEQFMPSRKSSTPTIQPIDGSILGEYAVSNYSERVYSKVYYSIRSLCGLVAKRSLKETFDWDEFKERFTTDFGNVEEKRYTLEQLLEYANRKFGKSLEDLIVQNQISWQRRQEYAERNQMHYQSETIEDSTHY